MKKEKTKKSKKRRDCPIDDTKNIPTHYMFMEPDETPEIIERAEWGALPFTSSEPVDLPYYYVRFQHTGPETCTTKEDCIKFVQRMQRDHMERLKLPDIQFNFLLSPEGYIFEGRGWFRDAFREGKHDENWRYKFINIAYIGDYMTTPLPMKLEAAGIELLKFAWLYDFLDHDPIPITHKLGNIDFTHYY